MESLKQQQLMLVFTSLPHVAVLPFFALSLKLLWTVNKDCD